MSFLASLRVALASLLVHKGRSMLTSLGIVIGIAAVIAMVAAGDGARTLLDDRLESVGKNLILVRPGRRTAQGMVADFSSLTDDDARAIRLQLGSLLAGVAETQVLQLPISSATATSDAPLVGCTPSLSIVRSWHVDSGRFLSADDVKKDALVCVLGQTTVRQLFPHEPDPLGRTLRVAALTLTVIGVLESKGRAPTGADQDDQVLIPLTTLQHKLANDSRLTLIMARARTEEEISGDEERIAALLRSRHHVKKGEEDFDVSSVHEMAELAVVVTNTMQLLVAVVAAISLVVGGIGIMNIMLVSVTERTREIGIRMAVGATPANVLLQFLIEAGVLSLVGGVLGVILGLAGAVGLAVVVGWPLVISPVAIVLACGVSVSVGIFFGYYPAWKASRLEPIEALHQE